jgi:uncharacterized membrane protein
MHRTFVVSVNEPVSESRLNGAVEIVARPNRSAGPATLLGVFVALSVSVFTVSLISFVFGNVLAPVFALLDVLLVGYCLRLVWRRGADFDRIRLGADEVAIESRRGAAARSVVYKTGWARVWSEPGGRDDLATVYVGSHGRRTEVGSFLAGAERARLESLIKIRLGQARPWSGHDAIENAARGHTA